jgi:PKHD-type hydroxylase
MNLKNYYWYFKKIIPERICDEILKLGLSRAARIATTGNIKVESLKGVSKEAKAQLKLLRTKRHSHVVWLEERWIWDLIQPCVRMANKNAGWNFEWDLTEPCQFTKYRKGQYYGWHCDSGETPYNTPGSPKHGKIRKLSTILMLSDNKDYSGGDLEMNPRQYDPEKKEEVKNQVIKVKELQEKGSIVVFPSFVWHRVTPVTKGLRYSVPAWHLGKPWT